MWRTLHKAFGFVFLSLWAITCKLLLYSQKICEKPQVVNDYEAGRAIPNQQILTKLERALGVKLRGKDKGQPLGGPKAK